MDRWQVGDVSVTRVLEMVERYAKPQTMFPDATPEALEPHLSWLMPEALCPETGKIVLAIQGYLVRTGRHTVLVDACIGNDKTIAWYESWNKRSNDSFLIQLAAAGVQPEEVDFVMCTHLHADHCGWNTRLIDGRWVPTFPNARYIMARREYEFTATGAGHRGDATYLENVLPVVEAGQAVMVEDDYSLDDALWIEPTPGHTPGHISIRLRSRDSHAVVSGDLIHSPVQCAHPDWNFRYDADKPLAAQTRRRFLETCAETQRLVLTSHFPLPSAGHVKRQGDAFRFDYLKD